MRSVLLPKNGGEPKLFWEGKHPFYKLGYTSPFVWHLACSYNQKANFIYKKIGYGKISSPAFLQSLYEKLTLFHGLLSSEGILFLECRSFLLCHVQALVEEVFGEGLQDRVFYIILRDDEKN